MFFKLTSLLLIAGVFFLVMWGQDSERLAAIYFICLILFGVCTVVMAAVYFYILGMDGKVDTRRRELYIFWILLMISLSFLGSLSILSFVQ